MTDNRISKTVRLLWRCARHSDHIATITTDIPFGDTEAHSATETPDGFADAPARTLDNRAGAVGGCASRRSLSARFPGLDEDPLSPCTENQVFGVCDPPGVRDQRTGAARVSPILETLRLENEGKKDPPVEIKLDTLPENSTSLRALRLRYIPLTNQLLRLTALTTLELYHHSIDLTTLLAFLAANEGLIFLKVVRRKLPTRTPTHREVSLCRVRQVELSSLAVEPLLAALRLPSPLDGLPGVAQATSPQYGVTQTLGQVVSGSSAGRGTFNMQGFFNPTLPTDF